MTSPEFGSSGVPSIAVAGAMIPDFRQMLRPKLSKPQGVPRIPTVDNWNKKLQKNPSQLKVHVIVAELLAYKRHVVKEPMEDVLAYPYALIAWLWSLEEEPNTGNLGAAIEVETLRQCMLDLATNAILPFTRGNALPAEGLARYRAASASYRAALDRLDAIILRCASRGIAA